MVSRACDSRLRYFLQRYICDESLGIRRMSQICPRRKQRSAPCNAISECLSDIGACGELQDHRGEKAVASADRAHDFDLRCVRPPRILACNRESTLVAEGQGQDRETRNMLSESAFNLMRDGVVIINTARGSLIDSHALIMALGSGKVSAARLDVLPDEPLIREEAELICSIFERRHDLRNLVADHVLMRMRNVIVTPHSAFNTREAIGRIVETTVSNIEAFLAGRHKNVVAHSASA